MLSTGTMKGAATNNPKGERLGDIKNLMIDLTSGRVACAVLAFGGLLGVGSSLIRWPAVNLHNWRQV